MFNAKKHLKHELPQTISSLEYIVWRPISVDFPFRLNPSSLFLSLSLSLSLTHLEYSVKRSTFQEYK
jgi:hypothetical protein